MFHHAMASRSTIQKVVSGLRSSPVLVVAKHVAVVAIYQMAVATVTIADTATLSIGKNLDLAR